ncbi:Hypothetical predicted protein [Lecanosticta acicola]|uniref:RanBD1 domain-containing protein n=1 Tax=Lecanosticta acicola TaxID=111012 RepID=A0AAI8YRE8_9PEZI|nr:Hypothetical predicted protein [Lecanosticta acicola]
MGYRERLDTSSFFDADFQPSNTLDHFLKRTPEMAFKGLDFTRKSRDWKYPAPAKRPTQAERERAAAARALEKATNSLQAEQDSAAVAADNDLAGTEPGQPGIAHPHAQGQEFVAEELNEGMEDCAAEDMDGMEKTCAAEDMDGMEKTNAIEEMNGMEKTDADSDRIAGMKKPAGVRGRSGSPATFSNPQPQQQSTFDSNRFGFAFGGASQQQDGSSSFSFGVSTPAPSFGASAPAPATNMQPNGNVFGQNTPNTPSFGTSFTGSSQPQQNGFNPSTTSMFNQQPQTPSFGGFGQTQQNGTSGFGGQQQPAQGGGNTFNFGQTRQQESSKPNTSFTGFGTSQSAQTESGNPFAKFIQKPAETSEKSSTPGPLFTQKSQNAGDKPSNPFASFGQKTAESSQNSSAPAPSFGQKPQENGSKPSNAFAGFGQQAQQKKDDKPSNPFANFGQKSADAGDKPSTPFGQKPLENGNKTPFATFGQQNEQKDKSSGQQTPKLGFGFGQPNGDNSGDQQQTPKPGILGQGPAQQTTQPEQSKLGASNIFNQSTQPSNQANNMFSQPSQSTQATSNMFGTSSQSTQPKGEKKGLFGSSVAPAGDDPHGTDSIFSNLPKKKDMSNGSKPLFSSADPSQVYRGEDDDDNANDEADGDAEQAEQPAAKPTGSFFGLSNQAQSSTAGLSTPQARQNPDAASSNVGGATQTPAPRSLFDRIDKDELAKRLGGPVSQNKPNETPKTGLFSGAPETPATVKPLFSSTAPSTTAAPLPSFQQPAVSQTPMGSPPKSLFPKPSTPALPAAPPTAFQAPATAPVALTAPPPSASAATSSTVLLSTEQKKLQELNHGLLDHLKRADNKQDWTAVMQYYMRMVAGIMNTSAPPEAQDSTIISPPATTSTSNTTFEQTARPAHTPKQLGGSDLFSKPPSTAPPGAKKRTFEQQEDDESARSPATEKRSKPNESVNYPKLPETSSSTSKLFADVLNKKDAANTSGFNPATKSMFNTSTPASSMTPTPATNGLSMPKFAAPAAGSNSFFASFGQKAKAQEEAERKKRKADDYDSEEESEEQWEKRDREEQEAKRQKLADAAKNAKGFSFSTPSTTTEGVKTPFKLGAASGATSATPSTQQPKFGGLFGASTTANGSTTEAGKLAPATGFSFGGLKTPSLNASLDASRATTPGVTTDGEASNAADEGDDEPSDEAPQNVEDHTALQAAERQSSDVLLELPQVNTKFYNKKEDEDKASWKPIQSGRMYVLKDKADGATRILAKVGLGRSALNYKMVKGMKYELHPKKDTMVVATFMDHIHSDPPKLERFYVTCANANEAKDLARVLTEGAAK